MSIEVFFFSHIIIINIKYEIQKTKYLQIKKPPISERFFLRKYYNYSARRRAIAASKLASGNAPEMTSYLPVLLLMRTLPGVPLTEKRDDPSVIFSSTFDLNVLSDTHLFIFSTLRPSSLIVVLTISCVGVPFVKIHSINAKYLSDPPSFPIHSAV